MARRVATLLSCCFAAVAATQGVPLEIVLSAVVFDGTATMDLNGPDNDAVQCLRAAIVAVLREAYRGTHVERPRFLLRGQRRRRLRCWRDTKSIKTGRCLVARRRAHTMYEDRGRR